MPIKTDVEFNWWWIRDTFWPAFKIQLVLLGFWFGLEIDASSISLTLFNVVFQLWWYKNGVTADLDDFVGESGFGVSSLLDADDDSGF